MVLAASNVLDYLLYRRLMSLDTVVDGDFTVVDVSSRHRNLRVVGGSAPGLFVKQVKRWEPDAIATLKREAACFWLAEHVPGFAALRPLLPRQVCFDAERSILITELVEGETLHRYYRRLGAFPVEMATRLAGMLASFHGEVRETVEPSTFHAGFPRQAPWMLAIDTFAPTSSARLSGGVKRLLEIVRESPEFHPALDALREGWRTDCFVHGDLRWDNILVTGGDGRGALKLVDWELADFGDPLWDVGGVFFAYLSSWVFSMPAAAADSVERLVGEAQSPLEDIQPAMRGFWHAYARSSGMAPTAVDEALERSLRYAAVRMIQSAYEQVVTADEMTPHAVCMLQLSANVLRDPASALQDLLGM